VFCLLTWEAPRPFAVTKDRAALTRKGIDGREFLAAAIQAKRRQVITAEQRAEVALDETAGGSAVAERLLEHVEVDARAAG
jgi:hypothetical protein